MRALKAPLKAIRLFLQIVAQTTGIARSVAPTLLVLNFLLSAFETLLLFAMLFILQVALNRFSFSFVGVSAGGENELPVGMLIAGSFFLVLAIVVVRALASQTSANLVLKITNQVARSVLEKTTRVPFAFFESPDYFDKFERARQQGAHVPSQFSTSVFQLFRLSLFLGIGALYCIITLPVLLVPLGLIAACALAIKFALSRKNYEEINEQVQKRRLVAYYDWLLTSKSFIKDIRSLDLSAFILGRHATLTDELTEQRVNMARRQAWSDIAFYLIVLASAALMLLIYAHVDIEFSPSIGQVVVFALIAFRGQMILQQFATQSAQIYENALNMRLLLDFLSLPTQDRETERLPSSIVVASSGGLHHGIEQLSGLVMDRVSFRYPDTDRWVLKDISLRFAPGSFSAFVGQNGSGKTSLVKLLGRLYRPAQGQILLDGQDIWQMERDDYIRALSILFQDHAMFAESSETNIWMGDSAQSIDHARLVEAAKTAGCHDVVEGLPSGYQTRLTRMFDDGVELSIGQWQKVAIARQLYRRARFTVLDEPTSALDAFSEMRLLGAIRKSYPERGLIVISHRLSSIQAADSIHVLQGGRIIESGRHKELMQLGGLYQRMFSAQSTDLSTMETGTTSFKHE